MSSPHFHVLTHRLTKTILSVTRIRTLFRRFCIFSWHLFSSTLPLWMRIGVFCLFSSLILVSFFDFDALVAPVMKMLIYCKLFFIKTLPAWIAFGQTSLKKGLAKVSLMLGSWEAWSFKKLFRHCIRFIVSFSARIVVLTFLINLFFGSERKGLKNIPRLVLIKLKGTWLNKALMWWSNTSERSKRISTGLILCVILVSVGQAFIGISILVFDLVWECLIVLARFTDKLWRWIYPILVRFLPNAIGSFFTNTVLPFFANAVPFVRDDHRVMYVRTLGRKNFREYKKRLLKFSRAKRPAVRARISPLISNTIKLKKSALLSKAAGLNNQTGNQAGKPGGNQVGSKE